MKCPACKNPLRGKGAGDITLDLCYGGCGGIWFDAAELGTRERPRLLILALARPFRGDPGIGSQPYQLIYDQPMEPVSPGHLSGKEL